MTELDINRKEMPLGSVVYFLTSNKHGMKHIKFGTVEEHYTHEICVQLYDYCERRTIDGVPVEEITTPTRWQKLPKGWSYNTRLFEMGYRPLPESAKTLSINNPSDILKAIEEGIFIKVQDLDYGRFEDVIDKEKGWRLERKYPSGEYHSPYATIRFHEVYTTYEQAEAVLNSEIAEFKRQSELSDYDWSVEQIDNKLGFWAFSRNISDEEKQRYREWILSLDRVEDVEVRIYGNDIQWKYWKNNRWMSIVL